MTWKTRYGGDVLLVLGASVCFGVACTHVSSTPLGDPQANAVQARPVVAVGEPSNGVPASKLQRASGASTMGVPTSSSLGTTASSTRATSDGDAIVSEPNYDTRVNSGAGNAIPVSTGAVP
jgi:hypothetical protein